MRPQLTFLTAFSLSLTLFTSAKPNNSLPVCTLSFQCLSPGCVPYSVYLHLLFSSFFTVSLPLTLSIAFPTKLHWISLAKIISSSMEFLLVLELSIVILFTFQLIF